MILDSNAEEKEALSKLLALEASSFRSFWLAAIHISTVFFWLGFSEGFPRDPT